MDFGNLNIPNYKKSDISHLVQNLFTSTSGITPSSLGKNLLTSIGGNKPPIDVELLAEKIGFDLIPIPGLRNISSTDAYLSHNKKEIAFDNDVVPVRIRFSIAHELGHYFLHKDILKEIRFCDYSEWKEVLSTIPGPIWGKVETQANEFAGQLLAPRDLIISAMVEFEEEIKLAQNIIPDDIESLREYLAFPLSKKFEMSENAIKFRLINEKINPYEFI